MKKIFDDFGIEIVTDDGKYYIKYDGGEIVEKIDIVEVNKADAILARKSQNEAYQIILKYQGL